MSGDRKLDCITVFGGSGFLGRKIVERLVAEGITTRVAVRHPESVKFPAETAGRTAEARVVYADVRDETSVALALEGSDAAVNAVGLYVEAGPETFEAVHELGALAVAHQCAALGIARLVHISGIGADLYSRAHYVRTRAKGELLVQDVFPRATILRPSVIFGPEDRFVNALAEIAQRAPVIPLFGRGLTRLQPVYVDDVAKAVVAALQRPDSAGATFELGGPKIYTYRQLIGGILQQIERRRLLLPVPFVLWDLLAAAASLFPSPPITRAQVTLMKRDNVVGANVLMLKGLGISPTALEAVLPHYTFAGSGP